MQWMHGDLIPVNQAPVIIGVGDYYTPGGRFELKAKIDPRGLTGANRPATLRMNVTLGKEVFPGYAGVSDGEWNKLSTKEWKAELK